MNENKKRGNKHNSREGLQPTIFYIESETLTTKTQYQNWPEANYKAGRTAPLQRSSENPAYSPMKISKMCMQKGKFFMYSLLTKFYLGMTH